MSSGETKECPELGKYQLINLDTSEVVPLPCKTYACEVCGKKKATLLAKKLEMAFSGFEYVRLFTFTLRTTSFVNQEHAILRISEIWRRFINNIRRDKSLSKKARNFQYVRVIEFTKRGYPHYHVLANEYIPQDRLYYYWTEAINTVIGLTGKNGSVNARGIKNAKKAGFYVAKYVLKSAKRFSEVRIGKIFEFKRVKLKLYTKSGDMLLNYPKCTLHHWVFSHVINSNIKDLEVEDNLTCIHRSQLPVNSYLIAIKLRPPDRNCMVYDGFQKNYNEILNYTQKNLIFS